LTAQEDGRVTRALGATFPAVDVISVREQLDAATGVFDRLALALRAAAGVALLAGLLVLAGALATGANTRMREAAILKVLGASRGQIMAAYGVEYGSVGLIAGMVGVLLGAMAAWPVIKFIFKSAWSFDWVAIAVLLAGVAAVTAGGGLVATWQALKRRPASALRTG
jgi:putative ABC transport system permease protein